MDDNIALTPAKIFVAPTEERFQDSYRRWQGIPSIEVSDKGRIFVNFYTGQGAEVGGNIMVLCTSDDGGETYPPWWSTRTPPAGSMIPASGSIPPTDCG